MFSKAITTAFAASALLASANAHFFIANPAPIPGSAIKDPLLASGTNFPCHSSFTGGQKTTMAAGSTQPLNFDLGGGANTAVHGGGSCQVSITYETDPDAMKLASNWKVLHSWVGGCPTNAPGNLDGSTPGGATSAVQCSGSDQTDCVNQDFSFQIPNEVKSGDATLAWTWYNNIGNREMYMNCAAVSITGGTGQMDSLPAMFVANIGNECSTTEGHNTDFPNPGQYVTKDSTLNYPLAAPVGSGCDSGSGSASVPASGSGTGTTGSGSGASGTPATGASPSAGAGAGAAPSAGAGAGSGSGSSAGSGSGSGKGGKGGKGGKSTPTANPGGAFAEGSGTATPTTLSAVASPAAAGTPAPSAPESGSTASSGSGSCTNGQVACSASGFYCISGTQFGMCAFGCATPMAVAAGTACSDGAVVHAVVPQKRHSRHMHRRSFMGHSF